MIIPAQPNPLTHREAPAALAAVPATAPSVPVTAEASGKVAIICLANASVTPEPSSIPTDSAPTKTPSALVVTRSTTLDGTDPPLDRLLSCSEPCPNNISTSATVLPASSTVEFKILYR